MAPKKAAEKAGKSPKKAPAKKEKKEKGRLLWCRQLHLEAGQAVWERLQGAAEQLGTGPPIKMGDPRPPGAAWWCCPPQHALWAVWCWWTCGGGCLGGHAVALP